MRKHPSPHLPTSPPPTAPHARSPARRHTPKVATLSRFVDRTTPVARPSPHMQHPSLAPTATPRVRITQSPLVSSRGMIPPAGFGRSSALAQAAQRVAARGMGSGMGGGGHANNPAFMFQADFAKNKWKGAVFTCTVAGLGILVPFYAVYFAQKKSGTW